MNVLHISNSSMAGAPVHLSTCLNKYSDGIVSCKSVLAQTFSHKDLDKLSWDYDYIGPENVDKLIKWADVLHFHNKPDYIGQEFPGKPSVLQFQSQPEHHGGPYINRSYYPQFKGTRTCIAQYHTRFFDYDYMVPNMIDIFDSIYDGSEKSEKVNIFFGYAWNAAGWSDKCVDEVTKVLEPYKETLDINIINNQPYKKMMKIKKKAHIVIGDLKTGSYHLNELEGLAVSAAVFSNIDELVSDNILTISKNTTAPFIRVNCDTLESAIDHFLERPADLTEYGKVNRAWMEKYWNPKNLIQQYIDIYKKEMERK